MLFTSLIRDGCRVKFGFPRVEKRFLAQFSFEDCLTSESEGEKGMAGLRPETEKAVLKQGASSSLWDKKSEQSSKMVSGILAATAVEHQ